MTYCFGGFLTFTSDAQAINTAFDELLTVPYSRIVTHVTSEGRRYNPCTVCIVPPAYHGDKTVVYVAIYDPFTGRESGKLARNLVEDLSAAIGERAYIVLTAYIANVTEDTYRAYKLRKGGVL